MIRKVPRPEPRIELTDADVKVVISSVQPHLKPLQFLEEAVHNFGTISYYTCAQLEQLDQDLDTALDSVYEFHKADSAEAFNKRLKLAIDLYPIKQEKRYGEYLREQYVKRQEEIDGPITRKERK